MNTFYVQFNITPTINNYNYDLVKDGIASCWVLENHDGDAYRKAKYHVERDDWNIDNAIGKIIEVSRDDFLNRDIGLNSYEKAQENKICIVYCCVSRDGKTNAGPVELQSKQVIELSEIFKEIKKNNENGRCLHYEAGNRCTNISSAHSIQKKGLLLKIAKDQHVYCFYMNYKNMELEYGKKGINKVSTFLGFCNKHDNELFEPIDNFDLEPNTKQVFLYSYRSLCREIFVKENSVTTFSNIRNKMQYQKAVDNLLISMKKGASNGIRILKKHKEFYDNSLKKGSYDDIQYLVFISKKPPTVVFSGLLYPDYDFCGNLLQNLADLNNVLDLITFCSAPLDDGWGFILAWHKSSRNICELFVKSLFDSVKYGNNLSDCLFRLVMSSENHAVSPVWWENLNNISKEKILSRARNTTDLMCHIPRNYLINGLDKISDWNFHNYESNIINSCYKV